MMRKVFFTALAGSACLSNQAFAKQFSGLRNLQDTEYSTEDAMVQSDTQSDSQNVEGVAEPLIYHTALLGAAPPNAPSDDVSSDSQNVDEVAEPIVYHPTMMGVESSDSDVVNNQEYNEMYTQDYAEPVAILASPAPEVASDDEVGYPVEMEMVYDEADEPEAEPLAMTEAISEDEVDNSDSEAGNEGEVDNSDSETDLVAQLQAEDNSEPPIDVDYSSDYDEESENEEILPTAVLGEAAGSANDSDEGTKTDKKHGSTKKQSDSDDDSESDIVVNVPNPTSTKKNSNSDDDKSDSSDIVVNVPNPTTEKGKKKKHSQAWLLRCRPNGN